MARWCPLPKRIDFQANNTTWLINEVFTDDLLQVFAYNDMTIGNNILFGKKLYRYRDERRDDVGLSWLLPSVHVANTDEQQVEGNCLIWKSHVTSYISLWYTETGCLNCCHLYLKHSACAFSNRSDWLTDSHSVCLSLATCHSCTFSALSLCVCV